MKKIIWCCLRWSRAKRTNPDVTALLYKCIDLIENCPTVEVEITYYDITIRTNNSIIRLWNANKFYAWIGDGIVNGDVFNGMPSRSASYDFKECLKNHGYNIYQPQSHLKINLDSIKC